MRTPASEVKAVTPYLSDVSQLENMILYIKFMKRYYELDRTIRNVHRERSDVLEELFSLSWTFDLKEFEKHVVRQMLICRRLTIKLVKLVKEWKQLRQRKTATLVVEVNDLPQRPTGLKSSTTRNSQT